MLDELLVRFYAARRRARRLERRELREFRLWIENTGNLIHLSVLLFVPLLIAAVTWISNAVDQLSFLLFPPLAAGAYTLFANPQGRYASPWRFVAGLTIGALCGWVAFETSSLLLSNGPGAVRVSAAGAGLGIFLTAIVTWGLDIEEPAAFSTALLVLVTGTSQLAYVLSIAVSSTLVAIVFVTWHSMFYERRARYLYQSTKGDDHVLVPVDGDRTEATALFGARIAAAHEAGKVVLLDVISDEEIADAERESADEDDLAPAAATEDRLTAEALDRLHRLEARIEAVADVPCELVIAADGDYEVETVLETAEETNCDLVVAPWDGPDRSPFLRGLFRSEVDSVAFRPADERTHWRRILVMVRKPGAQARRMLDFSRRLAGTTGQVSVCTCIDSSVERRPAERRLADLVETVSGPFETRVAQAPVEEFLAETASRYDLVVVGASTDRSAASRALSRPTFERIREIDCDLAIVHQG